MENFIVSARKYRPATFHTVVGQSSITATLKNSIKNRQLAHAYLFCGPRGVGKTTCARITAKTINCLNLTEDLEACDVCESCVGFNKSRSYNIHELDAASNNSVEDIRSLIDQVRIPPQIGKYSVYIIDEVHMLTTSAFNAFLKTLEEPPKHAIFVLATTEKHKILPTILSRCQIFDFNRITVEDAAKHLEYVAQQEGVEYEMEGLNIIAQKADGAMRDALSLFDQISSFSGGKITYEAVIENLNVLDYDYYFKLTEAFLEERFSDTLLLFNKILNKGFDGHHFIAGLCGHFRDLMVCKDEQTLQLLEVGASIREQYKLQAQKCSHHFLLEALNVSTKCDYSYKTSSNQRLHVELTLMQITGYFDKIRKDAEIMAARQFLMNAAANPQAFQQKAVAQSTTPTSSTTSTTTPQAQAVARTTKPQMSISAALNGKKTTEPTVEKTVSAPVVQEKVVEYQSADKHFSQDDLLKVWKDFTDTKASEPRTFNMLNANKPKLISQTTAEVLLANTLQYEAFLKLKKELVQYICGKLQNSKIELIEKVAQQNQQKKVLLSSADKLNYLISKNSTLEKLRQTFGLDLM